MKRFNKFYFESFEFSRDSLIAKFIYSFDKKEFFEEKIDFSCVNFKIIKNIDENILNNLLFQLHVALGISYYKIYPTKELAIESGSLDEYQIHFWKKFYQNGLGEFFIKNDIDPNGLLNFKNSSLHNLRRLYFTPKTDKSLLLLGGGKDSIVSYSLIKNLDYDLFVFGKIDDIKKDCSKLMNKNILNIKRNISDNLFRLNSIEGYYNGHVPITGIIAFVTLVVSYLYDYKYIILSNEKSSSEENTFWKGIKINHQYSKSLEFEKDLKEYIDEYISRDLHYFSLLRGMYEYKISEIFSRQTKFFNSFSSCNKNFKIIKEKNNSGTKWCCNCEKCVFVFLILFPFLREDTLSIFSQNLFEREDLLDIFSSLAGISNYKPFECVGTYEESLFCLYRSIIYYKENNENLPIVLYTLERKVLKALKRKDVDNIEQKLLKKYDYDIIPEEIKRKLEIYSI